MLRITCFAGPFGMAVEHSIKNQSPEAKAKAKAQATKAKFHHSLGLAGFAWSWQAWLVHSFGKAGLAGLAWS